MQKIQTLRNYDYVGSLADVCRDFVAEKRASGLKYESTAKKLSQMCRESLNYDITTNELPEDFVRAWIAKQPHETEGNRHSRYNAVRSLAQYMKRLGYEAFCPEKEDVAKHLCSFVPYIFTHDEIQRFFTAADNIRREKYSASPRYHITIPVMMRVLYCCGLRVSEVIGLLNSDVDLDVGILTIHASKLENSRYLPVSDELLCVLCEYAKTMPVYRNYDDYFFTAPDGGMYDSCAVYNAFRRILRDAGIPHGGKGNGPRVHDLRHTFAVHSLQKFISGGKDVTAMLPKLSAYLGHANFRCTEPYVRMTAEVYPEISVLLQDKYGRLIPNAEKYNEDY